MEYRIQPGNRQSTEQTPQKFLTSWANHPDQKALLEAWQSSWQPVPKRRRQDFSTTPLHESWRRRKVRLMFAQQDASQGSGAAARTFSHTSEQRLSHFGNSLTKLCGCKAFLRPSILKASSKVRVYLSRAWAQCCECVATARHGKKNQNNKNLNMIGGWR